MNIGDTIRRCRADRGLTQSELGEIVGVSAGAVSKWENSASLPDLQLVMPLARALGISTDTLLSYEAKLTDECLSEISQELTKVFLNEGYERGTAASSGYVREYPNSLGLKLIAANLMQMYLYMAVEDKHKEYYEKIKSLLKTVAQSGDSDYSSTAWFSLANTCLQLAEYEECEDILKNLSKANIDPSAIWLALLERQNRVADAQILCKQVILESSSKLTMGLAVLSRLLEKEDADRAVFYVDALEHIEKELKLLMPHASLKKADLLLKKGDKPAAAKSYLEYIKKILAAPYDYRGHPFFDGLELSSKEDVQKSVRTAMYKQMLDAPGTLAALADEQDYCTAIALLKEATEK